jgi:autotransporter-associated beta strand protein
VKTGAGTLVLKSVNSFASTAISGGVVETQVDGALGQVNINLSNGATWKITTNNQTAAANNTVNITGSATIDTQTDLNMVHSINGANVIFTKAGPGLLWARHNFPLTGASEVHVDGGTLRDSDDLTNYSDGIPDSVVLRIAAGATFDESFGNGEQFSALAGDGTYLGHHVANGAGHINFLNNTATTFTFNGIITAGTAGVVGTTPDEREILALRKNGIHTAVLTNPNSDFAGQVQINAGVLEIPHIANRGQNSPIGMGNIATAPATPGADITLGTSGLTTETAGTLRYSGPSASTDRTFNINNGSGTIEITNPATALTLSAPITGSNFTPLQKTGPGTLIFTNENNNFSGGIDVAAGKLLVNSPSGTGGGGGLVTVKDGGTIGGIGSIGATVLIKTGGTLSPGESIGTLKANGTVFEAGSKLLWELNTDTGAADLYNADGVIDLTGQAIIDLIDLGTPAAKSFTLIKYASGVNNFANLTIGATPNPQLTYTLVDNQANQSIDLSVTGSAAPPQWNVDGDGSWGLATNWVGGVPDSPTAIASFLGKITAPRTITVDGNRQVKQIVFDNANKYTIAPSPTTSRLTIGDGTSGSINVISGTHEIGVPLTLSGNVTKSGVGTVIVSGAQSHAAGASLAVTAGQAILRSNAGTAASAGSASVAPLSVSISGSGSKVTLAADQNLKSLAISTADVGTQSFDLNSPTTGGGFRAVHIYAADLAAAKTSLYAAIRNALGNPNDGIIDSGLASHAGAKIGIAQGPDAHGDQNIFIRPTRVGDLNLDGVVTISDFIDLASNFNKTNTTWQEGDLNYDGSVTISDFIDLASNFNGSYSGETFPISDADAKALSDFASAHGVSVPEPAMLGLLLGTVAIARTRRNRSYRD